MPIELSKKNRRIAREVIKKGLEKEFHQGLVEMNTILEQWKANTTETRDAYQKLYKAVTDFDKHIGRRYDYMRPATYLFVLAAQLSEGLIKEEDLSELDQPVRNAVLMLHDA